MVTLGILITCSMLVIISDVRVAVVGYVAFTAMIIVLLAHHESGATAITLLALIAFAKLLVGPAALVFVTLRYRLPWNLLPSANLPLRIVTVVAMAFIAHAIGRMDAFAPIHQASIVFFALFASVATVVLHRSLLAHIMGLLMLGGAITLAGASFAPSLPGAVELADTFDIIMTTFVALGVVRALLAHDPRVTITALRDLRG